jgi:cytochrome-b5 reductase
MSSSPNPLLTKAYVDGVYIPSGLLIVGTLIVKREWVPYAILLALALGGYKVWSNSTVQPLFPATSVIPLKSRLTLRIGVQSVLKPAVFQNFELKEKTVISHNVAMYANRPSTLLLRTAC